MAMRSACVAFMFFNYCTATRFHVVETSDAFSLSIGGQQWFTAGAPFATINGITYTTSDEMHPLHKIGGPHKSTGSDKVGSFSRNVTQNLTFTSTCRVTSLRASGRSCLTQNAA